MLGNATRVPENPGNPPVFKPGFESVQKPGFDGCNIDCRYCTEKWVAKQTERQNRSNFKKIG